MMFYAGRGFFGAKLSASYWNFSTSCIFWTSPTISCEMRENFCRSSDFAVQDTLPQSSSAVAVVEVVSSYAISISSQTASGVAAFSPSW